MRKTFCKRFVAWLPFGDNDRKRVAKGWGRFTHEIKEERERLEKEEETLND